MADQALKDNPPSLDAAAAKIEAAVAARLKAVASANEEIKKDPKDFVQRGKSDFFARPKEYMGYRFAMRIGLPGDYNYSNFADEAFALKDNELGKALEPAGARAVFLLKRIAVKPADRAEFEKNLAGITEDLLAPQTRNGPTDLARRRAPFRAAVAGSDGLPRPADVMTLSHSGKSAGAARPGG